MTALSTYCRSVVKNLKMNVRIVWNRHFFYWLVYLTLSGFLLIVTPLMVSHPDKVLRAAALQGATETPTASPTITPSPTVTPTSSETPTPSATATLSSASTNLAEIQTMVQLFEKTSTATLDTVRFFVLIFGLGGIVTGYFSIKTILDFQTQAETAKTQLHTTHQKFSSDVDVVLKDAKDQLEILKSKLADLERRGSGFDFFVRALEIRAQNPKEIRIRAAQQLAWASDILAIPILAQELAKKPRTDNDDDAAVKQEAATSLGIFLVRDGEEPDTYSYGINALHNGSLDPLPNIRAACFDALAKIASDKMKKADPSFPFRFSREIVNRLHAAIDYDHSEEVRNAARRVLKILGDPE